MPRDIPVGNGDLLVTFDHLYRVRDLYFPHVGKHNHTGGHVQRFGVWADGALAWVEEEGWSRELRYKADTLVTDVRLTHDRLGLELTCNDAVDFHEAVLFRHISVRDLKGKPRDVRLFFHVDLSINGSAVGDTANYDPGTSAVVLYKDDAYFLINACDRHKCGIDHWAIGAKRVGGAEGTWRDAEDGQLGRNAISQGSVDATVGFNLMVPANGEAHVTSWIACGHSYDQVRALNDRIWTKGADKMLQRTEAYWRLWCRKEPIDTSPLPEPIRDLYYRSQLILRTQIDNGGAIIAANDSDITHFAGDHYSYCWMRDGALVANALIMSGQSELSRAFFRFAGGCVEDEGYFLHKYTPEGALASSWHPWMLDGKKILPIQQDETALVLWALRRHYDRFRDVEFIKPLYSRSGREAAGGCWPTATTAGSPALVGPVGERPGRASVHVRRDDPGAVRRGPVARRTSASPTVPSPSASADRMKRRPVQALHVAPGPQLLRPDGRPPRRRDVPPGHDAGLGELRGCSRSPGSTRTTRRSSTRCGSTRDALLVKTSDGGYA
ncbi:MAG: hypothetical protein R3B57_01695 [Phycisphaerales bacterium]